MTICSEKHCYDSIKPGGFVCVVCERGFCAHHSGEAELALQCCDNDMRQCAGCEAVKPATEGLHVRDEFHCAACLGISNDELRALEAA